MTRATTSMTRGSPQIESGALSNCFSVAFWTGAIPWYRGLESPMGANFGKGILDLC